MIQGFYLYLYSVSLLFLFYVYVYLLHDLPSSSEQSEYRNYASLSLSSF